MSNTWKNNDSIRTLTNKYNSTAENLKGISNSIQDLAKDTQNIPIISNRVNELDNELTQKIADVDEKVTDLRSDLSTVSLERASDDLGSALEDNKFFNSEKDREQDSRLDSIESKHADLVNEVETVHSDIEAINGNLHGVGTEIENLNVSVSALKEIQSGSQNEKDHDEIRGEIANNTRELESYKSEADRLYLKHTGGVLTSNFNEFTYTSSITTKEVYDAVILERVLKSVFTSDDALTVYKDLNNTAFPLKSIVYKSSVKVDLRIEINTWLWYAVLPVATDYITFDLDKLSYNLADHQPNHEATDVPPTTANLAEAEVTSISFVLENSYEVGDNAEFTLQAIEGVTRGTLSEDLNANVIRKLKNSYIPKTGGEVTGALKGVTPEPTDSSNTFATTEWVYGKIPASTRSIGELIYSSIPLFDGGLHLLDGDLISASNGYEKFIDYMLQIYDKYPKLFIAEEGYQESLNSFGVCGKFVLDKANRTVRLPTITGIIEGAVDIDRLGTLAEAGLPNITGTAATALNISNISSVADYTGAFSSTTYSTQTDSNIGSGANQDKVFNFRFDASKANSIYGRSDTVQPQTVKQFVYICINNGFTTETLDVSKETQLNIPFSMFETKLSDCLLDNLSWVRSQGQFNSKTVYKTAYEYLLDQVSNPTRGLSIKLFTEPYTDTDFVLNPKNETFRLPKVNGYILAQTKALNKRILIAKKAPTATDPIWYNYYSDGWLEQGGSTTGTGEYGITTIRFEKPFRDTTYFIVGGIDWSDTTLGAAGWYTSNATPICSQSTDISGSILNRTPTTFDIQKCTSQRWAAQGYGEEPSPADVKVTEYLYFYVGETATNSNLVEAGRLTEAVVDMSSKLSSQGITQPTLVPLIEKVCTPDPVTVVDKTIDTARGISFYTNGDVYLIDDFTKYNKIMIITSDTGSAGDGLKSTILDSWELLYGLEHCYSYNIVSCNNDNYWNIWGTKVLGTANHAVSTTRCFKACAIGCEIIDVIGVKY